MADAMQDYHGYDAISAPNRYRKMLKPMLDGASVSGSTGALLFFASDGGNSPQWKRIAADVLDLQKREWPERADRALGMEPSIDLTDILLLWGRS